MVFNSLTFIVFLACVLLLHSLPLSWSVKKLNLLVASYLFYAAWNPPFVVLLWISTLADWFVARGIERAEGRAARRGLLLLSLCINLGLLGYFKYGIFLLDNFTALLALTGIEFQPAAPDIVLPIGISFYTFQTLSYSIDVYRGRLRPWGSFRDYALYVSFFPQLVSGPIVRAAQFLPQCVEPKRAGARELGWGLSLLAIGLCEKIVLADAVFAPVADKVYAAPHEAGFDAAWIGSLAFSGQIFCDFSGYSLCAIGVAMCLGFSIPDNFRFPYAAVGFSDFWRRWHVSLSSWLRDYLYISLGGNRRGAARTYANLLLTMLIGGLWHGASWTFFAWGGLHGLYLAIERPLRDRWAGGRPSRSTALRLPLALLTFLAVSVAWTIFRAQSFEGAFELLWAMFSGGPGPMRIPPFERWTVLVVISGLLAGHWLLRDSSLEQAAKRLSWWARALVLALILVCILLAPGEDRVFIYFQF